MSYATRPAPSSGRSRRAGRRILVAAGLAVVALLVGAHSSGSTTPPASTAAEAAVGLPLPIFTPPPTTPAVRARTASGLEPSSGHQALLDVLNGNGGPDFVAVPDANLVDLVAATCADLAVGNSVGQSLRDTEFGAQVYRPKWVLTDGDIGFLVGAAVAVLCPEFTSLVEHWTLADNTNTGVAP